jgi:Zn-dependent M28 family amino/carboxypeptidase
MTHPTRARLAVGIVLNLAVTAGCGTTADPADTIHAASLLADVKLLASDEFGGRAPGSPGEARTVEFLTRAFQTMGLEPGNPDGTYVQRVPLVGITAAPDMTLTIVTPRGTEPLAPRADFVAWTKRVVEEASIDAELVFVGHGVTAPEYQWDDFKGEDVSGKVLVFLVNDPPGGDIFGGDAMTYYGRWTYKFEQAARLGAAGAFIVHDTVPAGYPWDVVTGSWTGEQFDLATPDRNMGRAAIEGWITLDRARSVATMAGLDFDDLRQRARTREFRPVPLGARARLTVRNTLRTIDSSNVVARLPGTDAPDEVVIYLAHWDHLGTDPDLAGDTVYNGAVDNATGTAGLLAIARAFAGMRPAPRRSVLFLAVTAEEQGLLGSRYYARQPLYPPERTVAAINMDGLNVIGPTRDLTVIGMGQSSLDGLAARHAAASGRVLRPDAEPEKGFYYRSDHFELAKAGIPAFYADAGIDVIGQPAEWALEQRRLYTERDYHKPSDEVRDSWNLEGAVEDLRLFARMGIDLAQGTGWPAWSETSEFRAVREASLAKGRP